MGCELHRSFWSAAILATATLATALVYVRGFWRLRRRFPEIAAGCRPAAFLGGLLILWIVIGTPLSTLDQRLLTFHMLQHLVLMTIAAPLLLVSAPGDAFLCGLPHSIRRAVVRILRSAPAVRIGRTLTHPVVCWLAGTCVVVAWHVPLAHEMSMRSQTWHLVQLGSFFAAALLFWWPVIERKCASARLPLPFVPLYLFLATLPCDALSAFLAFCGRVIYLSHASAPALLGLTPMRDQECAGALMWFWVTIAYLVPAVAVTLRMLSPSKRVNTASERPAWVVQRATP
jgi:putative membrane protein